MVLICLGGNSIDDGTNEDNTGELLDNITVEAIGVAVTKRQGGQNNKHTYQGNNT